MPQSDQNIDRVRYTVLPRALVFLTRGESILLLKVATKKGGWAGKYNGIGGHVEQGESALEAAKRELLEETGLQAELRLAGTVIVDAGERVGVCLFVFRGESALGEPVRSAEGLAEWIPFARLAELPLVEDVADLLNHLRGMDESAPPFSARSFYDGEGRLRVEFTE